MWSSTFIFVICFWTPFGLPSKSSSVDWPVGRGRFPAKELAGYIIARVVRATGGALVLYFVATGKASFEVGDFAANIYGAHSPGGYSFLACLVAEFVLTFFFLFIILGSTHSKGPAGLARIAIVLCLTLIHLISIPVTNTSVNPARSLSQALFSNDWD